MRCVGVSFWIDGTPLDKNMTTSIVPVWLYLTNVDEPHRSSPGHRMIVGFIDTLSELAFKRPDGNPCGAEEKAMIRSKLFHASLSLILRPFRDLEADFDCDGSKLNYMDGPGFRPAGGLVADQVLPGGANVIAPTVFKPTMITCDGKEAYSLLLSMTNWDAYSGMPGETFGRTDLKMDDTVVTAVSEWKRHNKRVWDAFVKHWRQEDGCLNLSQLSALRSSLGVSGGTTGLHGFSIDEIRLVVICEDLHNKWEGIGLSYMELSKLAFSTAQLNSMDQLLSDFANPDQRYFPSARSFHGLFLSGEQHRLLQEAFPLALELARRNDPDSWTEHHEVVLDCAVAYSAWVKASCVGLVEIPNTLDAIEKLTTVFVDALRAMRIAFAQVGIEVARRKGKLKKPAAPAKRDEKATNTAESCRAGKVVDDLTRDATSSRSGRSLKPPRKPDDYDEASSAASTPHPFKKGDTVSYEHDGEQYEGFIRKIEGDSIYIVDEIYPDELIVVNRNGWSKLAHAGNHRRRHKDKRMLYEHLELSDHDYTFQDRGFKRRTLVYGALMIGYHGPACCRDTGPLEATNKGIKKLYQLTNKWKSGYTMQIACNIERNDMHMMSLWLQEQKSPRAEAVGPVPIDEAETKPEHRLTHPVASAKVLAKHAEHVKYSRELEMHRAEALDLSFPIKRAVWAGTSAGQAVGTRLLLNAAGRYQPIAGNGDKTRRWLQQTGAEGGNEPWFLCQPESGVVKGIELHWRLIGTRHHIATVKAATGGALELVFVISRKWLVEHKLLPNTARPGKERMVRTVLPGVSLHQVVEPDLPPSLAPAGLPAGLARLASARCKGDNLQYGPANVKTYRKVRLSHGGRITAPAVADQGGKKVLVRAFLTCQGDGMQLPEKLALVTPLAEVADVNPPNRPTRNAGWDCLGMALFGAAGADALCDVNELEPLRDYATPVTAGPGILAAVAPWIGARLSLSRGARTAEDEGEDENETGDE